MTQYQRFELSRLDEEIAELEKKLTFKHEQRRELVNRMGLNKGGALNSDKVYVVGDSSTDTLVPNKCDHKRKTCIDVMAMSDDKNKLDVQFGDWGSELFWQHEELKP